MVRRLDATGGRLEELVGELRSESGFIFGKARDAARTIVAEVGERGDEALLKYTERFDGVRPDPVRVPVAEIERAGARLDERVKSSLQTSIANIQAFHERELESSWEMESKGASLGQRVSPLRRVGLYVPGGHAAYPSTLVMSVVPALVAGVGEIAVCSPPDGRGLANELVLATAALLGLEEVYAVGGAQAVAAMAYGTASIPAVEKICGPGNDYVTAAKLEVFGMVGIDAPQGPSEIVVLADDSAEPRYVAFDLMAQAEHLAGASAVLITPDADLIESVEPLLDGEPARHITLVETGDLEEAVRLCNLYAPEHAHVMMQSPDAVASKLHTAGLLAVGEWTPVALTDYAAGPSHALPTGGAARWASALSTREFTRRTGYARFGQRALEELGPHVARLARLEGLEHHARSVEIRMEEGK